MKLRKGIILNSLQKWIYRIYKKLQIVSIWVTFIHFNHNRLIPWLKKETRPCRYNPKLLSFSLHDYTSIKSMDELKVIFICDEMTYRDFENECQAAYITPSNWLRVFESFKPDVFFCESAWSGIDRNKNRWRGRIYKNEKVNFENRQDLLNILDYCKRKGIKTVFWNKEDPVFFYNKAYNFVDTALKFDYIFTTSKECVPLYHELGHQNVDVLMFGFSPKLFNPLNSGHADNSAVFAGSWYADQLDRCRDMEDCFDQILQKGIKLQIYNRHSDSANPDHKFPDKYASFISNCISFHELSSVLKQFRYVININTTKDSETMFARRVFEIMACNILIISNDSIGLKRLFDKHIWFFDQDFDHSSVKSICEENVRVVFQHHTCKQRLLHMLDVIKISYRKEQERVLILYNGVSADIEKFQQHFDQIPYQEKCGWFSNGQSFFRLNESLEYTEQHFVEECSGYNYFIIGDAEYPLKVDIEYALKHFAYVEENAGIREGEPIYHYVCDSNNTNTLFKMDNFMELLRNNNQSAKKYLI